MALGVRKFPPLDIVVVKETRSGCSRGRQVTCLRLPRMFQCWMKDFMPGEVTRHGIVGGPGWTHTDGQRKELIVTD